MQSIAHNVHHRAMRAMTVLANACVLLFASETGAQVSPEDHAKHHPATAGAGAMPTTPGAAPAMGAMPAASGSPAPGGMGDMGEMMKEMMGGVPTKELYPSLMAVPELTLEKRKQVEAQADERMHAGTVLMGQALDTLNAGSQAGDYTAMHEAMTRLREGAAQLESGIAARRALAEGRAPREVALAWFKQEMNLSPAAHQGSGVTIFHLFTMVLLIAFALAMVAMYFFKMRRAAALFGRIEADKGSPPPGSSPPLSGAPGPTADKPAAP